MVAGVTRALGCLAFGTLVGIALAAVVGVVLITFPETLLDLGDAVYDEHGHYQGMRQ